MQRYPLSRSIFTRDRSSPASRAGVTLVEVLMSLLVMSVSVVSVATLFPLSLLRSVQARQLTQATILRYNAENLIEIQPNLFSHMNNNAVFQGIPPGRTVIIDPLGWHLLWEGNPGNTRYRNWFGGRVNGLRRFNSGMRNAEDPKTLASNTSFQNQARDLVSQHDTWIEMTRGVPDPDGGYQLVNNVATLTMPNDVDVASIPTRPLGISRVTIYHPQGRYSDVRIIDKTDIPNNSITLKVPPSSRVFETDSNNINITRLGEVRIEISEQRYTWLMMVRPSVRSADVVVFFRRSFSEEDEFIHPTTFLPISMGPDKAPGRFDFDDDKKNGKDDPGELGWPGTDDHPNRRVTIRWPAQSDARPSIRRNGFVFDVQNALWYRIHRVEDEKEGNKSNNVPASAVLVLDDVIKKKGSGGAMLMRGVVEVFPISF